MTEQEYPVDLDLLIAKKLEHTLTAEEALRLATLLKSLPAAMEKYRQNIWCDFFLMELFSDREKPKCLLPLESITTLDCTSSIIASNNDYDWFHISSYNREPNVIIMPCYEEKKKKSPHVWARLLNAVLDKKHRSRLKKGLTVFILGMVALFFILRSWNGENVTMEETPKTVARLVESLNPVYEEGYGGLARGQNIDAGEIRLLAGTVILEMVNGAQVVLEGPAHFMINDEMSAYCSQGRLSANIPPRAVGFEVMTPFGSVVDRGTKFYLDVQNEGAQVSVIQGKVDLAVHKRKPFSMTVGNAFQFDFQRNVKTIEPALQSFQSREQVEKKVREQMDVVAPKRAQWYKQLNENPNLMAHFRVESMTSNVLYNAAQKGAKFCDKMNLFGCVTTAGKLYGETSLSFDSANSYASFPMPVKGRSMSFFATVWMGRQKNQGGALLSSDQFLEVPGSILWQVMKTGEIIFYITDKNNKGILFPSPVVLEKKNAGKWYTLGVVVDGSKNTISHYIDGKRIASLPWNEPMELNPGPMTLANIKGSRSKFKDRNFTGSVQDLMIFNRVLAPSEIQKIHRHTELMIDE